MNQIASSLYAGLVAAYLICTSSNLYAGLRWDREEMLLRATSKQKAIEVEFGFVNTSAGNITIQKVQPSCACTSATIGERPANPTYRPGERGEIRVVVDVSRIVSVSIQRIKVISTDRERPALELKVQVEVDGPVSIDPPALIWKLDEAPIRKSITIHSKDDQDLHFAPLVIGVDRMGINLVRQSKREATLNVTPIDTKSLTEGYADLDIGTALGEDAKDYRIPLGVRSSVTTPGQPWLMSDGDQIHVGVVHNSNIIEHIVMLRNDGSEDIDITSVKTSTSRLKATLARKTLHPGERIPLTLSMWLSGRWDRPLETIEIRSTDPVKPVLTLRLLGVGNRDILAKPCQVILGRLAVHDEVIRKCDIFAQEAGTKFTIKSASVSLDGFIVEVVEHNTDGRQTIRLKNTGGLKRGILNGEIVISTDSVLCPTIRVPVYGQVE